MVGGARFRQLIAAVIVVLSAVACGSGPSGVPTPNFSDPCPAKPQGGALCIKVLATKGVVGDVIGFVSATSSPLRGKRWRLVLSSYPCDPGTDATAACPATRAYPSVTHRGLPPIETFCRLANGRTTTASPGCHDTLKSDYASQGDWPGFPISGGGFRVGQQTWLCISEQIAAGGRWTAPAPALGTTPTRACSAVSPA